MARASVKTILWGIAYLPIFLVTLLVVTDVEVVGRHLYGEGNFDFGLFLVELWPEPILKATLALAAFVTLTSKRFHDYLGRLNVRGTTFVLLFYLVLLVTCLLIVDHYQLYYPNVFDSGRELLAMKVALLVLPVPFVAHLLNDFLARPAPTALIFALWALMFGVVKIWSSYAFTGDLDFMSPLTMWFDD